MKKLLKFCMVAMFAVCASGTHAMAAATPVKECSQHGIKLENMETEPVSCSDFGLANARTCVAYCDDGEMTFGIRSCLDGYFALEPYSDIPDLFKQCGDERAACLAENSRNSGARWNVGIDGRGKCDCGDMEWNKDTMRCEESENQKACKRSGSNAHWENRQCVCNDSQQYRWDDERHKCVPYIKKVECDRYAQMSGSGRFDGLVQWNPATHDCECIKDKDGNNIANPDDWKIDVVNNFGCVKKESAVRREGFTANKPAADDARREIDGIVAELNDIADAWERSRWKNAQGKFNTARLASDSIAGVVLGTVGGVITSNVIKKNQVKNGFEDLNCTIGGQRVADYADQFRVGIR